MRFVIGTFGALDAVKHPTESRADMIRLAVRDFIEKRQVEAQRMRAAVSAAVKPRKPP